MLCNNFHLIPHLLIDLIFTKESLQIFTKECHLLSDKLETIEIKTPSGFNDKLKGVVQGFIIESRGGLNFH